MSSYIAYMDPMGNWLVVWNMTFIFPQYMGCHPSQLTKSYFSRWFESHQPAKEHLKIHGLVFQRSVQNC